MIEVMIDMGDAPLALAKFAEYLSVRNSTGSS